MMQAEMALAQATGGNNAKENGSKSRDVNPMICHSFGEAGHVA